jgi:hypothetical protein
MIACQSGNYLPGRNRHDLTVARHECAREFLVSSLDRAHIQGSRRSEHKARDAAFERRRAAWDTEPDVVEAVARCKPARSIPSLVPRWRWLKEHKLYQPAAANSCRPSGQGVPEKIIGRTAMLGKIKINLDNVV